MAKWATEIDDADRIPEIVGRAWRVALSGRPGPVVIALPEDMLTTLTSVQPCKKIAVAEAGVDTSSLTDVATILSAAERHWCLLGVAAGQNKGKADVQAFCERENLLLLLCSAITILLIITASVMLGMLGLVWRHTSPRRIEDADVILAVNARFGEAQRKPGPCWMCLIQSNALSRHMLPMPRLVKFINRSWRYMPVQIDFLRPCWK